MQPRIFEWKGSGSLVVKKNKKNGMKKANTRSLWKKQVKQKQQKEKLIAQPKSLAERALDKQKKKEKEEKENPN